VSRIVGVSLKMYLDVDETRRWLERVAELSREMADAAVEVFVAPSFLSLTTAHEVLAGTPVRYGAQDVFWEDRGPFTGEVSALMLREVGCSYAEVGHAERRRLFAEDDSVTARKAMAAARAGLVPVVCVGETHRAEADAAARECEAQLEPVLRAVSDDADLVLAYEPVWAIGAPEPAGSEHVRAVAGRLRRRVAHRPGRTRLIYGGAAGRGLFAALAGEVDGLFLGRCAHDVENLGSVITEISAAPARSAR
jgi:triosephosphate isomerase